MRPRIVCQYGQHALLPLCLAVFARHCSTERSQLLSFICLLSLLYKLHCFCVRCPTSGKRVPPPWSRWGISPLRCAKLTDSLFCCCYPYQDAVPQCNAQPVDMRQWHEGISKALRVCVLTIMQCETEICKSKRSKSSVSEQSRGVQVWKHPDFCFSSRQILPPSFKISQTVELKGTIIDSNQKVIFNPYLILVHTVGSNAKICFLFTYNEEKHLLHCLNTNVPSGALRFLIMTSRRLIKSQRLKNKKTIHRVKVKMITYTLVNMDNTDELLIIDALFNKILEQ